MIFYCLESDREVEQLSDRATFSVENERSKWIVLSIRAVEPELACLILGVELILAIVPSEEHSQKEDTRSYEGKKPCLQYLLYVGIDVFFPPDCKVDVHVNEEGAEAAADSTDEDCGRNVKQSVFFAFELTELQSSSVCQ